MQKYLNRFRGRRIKRLVNKLNKLCEKLNEDYSINCGGCCFVASVIAKKLVENHIKYEVGIDGVFNENALTGVYIRHVVVKVNDRIINDVDNDYIYEWYSLSPEQICQLYKNEKLKWNTRYDTYYNDLIEKTINEL